MRISCDLAGRAKTFKERGLDMYRAKEVFAGPHFTLADTTRHDYGEPRYITAGKLDERIVVLVWTPRGAAARRIISMRKANEREQERYTRYLD